MSEKPEDALREDEKENRREAQGQPGDMAGEGNGAEDVEGLRQEVARLQQEKQELFEQVLRRQADFENYRKRVQRERAEWRDDALGDFIKKMLPLLDSLERALKSSDTREEKGLKEGLEMVHKQFMALLREEGVEEIACRGDDFDPHIHEAVMVVDSEEHGENTVVDELQKGYKLKDRILRCSMVTVAK